MSNKFIFKIHFKLLQSGQPHNNECHSHSLNKSSQRADNIVRNYYE